MHLINFQKKSNDIVTGHMSFGGRLIAEIWRIDTNLEIEAAPVGSACNGGERGGVWLEEQEMEDDKEVEEGANIDSLGHFPVLGQTIRAPLPPTPPTQALPSHPVPSRILSGLPRGRRWTTTHHLRPPHLLRWPLPLNTSTRGGGRGCHPLTSGLIPQGRR